MKRLTNKKTRRIQKNNSMNNIPLSEKEKLWLSYEEGEYINSEQKKINKLSKNELITKLSKLDRNTLEKIFVNLHRLNQLSDEY